MRNTLAGLIAAIALSACGGSDGPATTNNAVPDSVVDALSQPQWGPLESWDRELEPGEVLTGGAGVIINYRTDTEPFFGASFHGGDGWIPLDTEEHFGVDEERLSLPRYFVGPRSIVILLDGQIVESTNGVEWVGPFDVGSAELYTQISRDEDALVVTVADQRTVVDEWRSTEIGQWEQADLSSFDLLEDHLATLPAELGVAAGPAIRRQFFGNGGQRLLDLTPRDSQSGTLLATFDGEQWHTTAPFGLTDGTNDVVLATDVWWSEQDQQWIAIGPMENELAVSESTDGIAWQIREDVVGPPVADGTSIRPMLEGGRVAVIVLTESVTFTTVDFMTWERFTAREDTLTRVFEIGNGECLGFRIWIGQTEPGSEVLGGPCPFSITEDGAPLSPEVAAVGEPLATDPSSWDGMVEQAYDDVSDHETTLIDFGFLAESACLGFFTSEVAASAQNVSTEESSAVLAVATDANCDTRVDGSDPVDVGADNWDDMIDERFAMITHQRMTRQGFDASAASECENVDRLDANRYNNGERAQILGVLEFDCDLLSSRTATDWNGTLLIASRIDGAEFDLFTISAQDGQVETTQLTTNPAFDHRGEFSPDGSEVVFTTETDGAFDIARVDATGGEVTLITSDEVYDGRPSVSPDGSQIVFETDSHGGISIVDADGSNREIISDGTDNSFSLGFESYDSAWSPDGSKVAFYGGGSPSELWIHDMDSGVTQSLTPEPEGSFDDFSWSPDSERIVFTGPSKDRDDGDDLWMVNVSSGDTPFRLLDLPGAQRGAKWSPDGTHIAFVNSTWGDTRVVEQIFVLNVETQELTQLTSDPNGAQWPLWSPDGDSIAYIRSIPAGGFANTDTDPFVAIVDLDGNVTLTGQRGTPLDWKQ